MTDENIIALAKQDATYIEALELVIAWAKGTQTEVDTTDLSEAAAIVEARLELDFPST